MTYLLVLHFRLQSCKCYIWKLLIVPPAQAMCHTYDSHLGEYINLLCRGKRTQLFTKSCQCSDFIVVLWHFRKFIESGSEEKGPWCHSFLYIDGIYQNQTIFLVNFKAMKPVNFNARCFQCICIFVAYFRTDWKCTFDAQEMHLSWLKLLPVSNIVWNKSTGCKFISAWEKLSQW